MAHDDRVENALRLLETLSAAREHRVRNSELRQELGCSESELDGYISLLSTLSDRESGARAIVYRDGEDLVLEGDAAQMRPLRLSGGEHIALRHVLDSLNLDAGLARRLAQALGESSSCLAEQESHLASARGFGTCYQQLSEAIADGVRCRILYRSQTEPSASWRTVDPIGIDATDDKVYLTAWNVIKDTGRRYRLDRVVAVDPTEDSVEEHHLVHGSIPESFAANGERVVIEFADHDRRVRSWTGIAGHVPAPTPGRVRATVYVTTPTWLFDQILAAGGDLEIIEPSHLRDELSSYARGLLGSR